MAEIYTGLDTAAYPGEAWARQVYNQTNIWYLGYYLGGPNAAAGTESWLGNRAFLAGLGFGFVPIYVGQQVDATRFHSILTVQQGRADAQEAVSIMTSEGFPTGSVCYLDVEDRVATGKLLNYIGAWIQGVRASGFRAGVYCDGSPGGVADQVYGKVGDIFYLWAVPPGPEIWISVHPTVDAKGYQTYPTYDPISYHAKALGVQYALAGFSGDPPTVFDVQVDLDSFPTKDPSMPDKGRVLGPGYPERKLSVTDDGWLFDVADNKWVKLDSFPNAHFQTDSSGWPYIVRSSLAAGFEEVLPSTATLSERIQAATDYGMRMVEANIPYYIWREGVLLNVDGPPAYAVPGAPPTPDLITAVFCAGVGNLMRRKVGLAPPKHLTTPGYDGGTGAWNQHFWDNSIWFDLDQAEEGDIAFRPYGYGGPSDQGHWCYVGPNQIAIQSYPDTWEGTVVEPGMNADWTLAQSHDGGYYIVLIKAKDWLL